MLPNGGNRPPLTMQDINGSSGFSGRGNNLAAYRGTLFYRPDNSTGYFPASPNSIAFTDFYSTQATSPVVAGNSGNITSGSSIILPAMFNKLYVTVYGAGGGGGGGTIVKDINTNSYGVNGSSGTSTIFGPVNGVSVTAPPGTGGQRGGIGPTSNENGDPGTDGTIQSGLDASGIADGGNYGQGYGSYNVTIGPYTYTYYGRRGGNGGKGGKSYGLVLDIDVLGWSTIKQFYGASVPITIGTGGAGGRGGAIFGYGAAGSGTKGDNGYIYISWT